MTKTQWFIISILGIGVLVVFCCGIGFVALLLSSPRANTPIAADTGDLASSSSSARSTVPSTIPTLVQLPTPSPRPTNTLIPASTPVPTPAPPTAKPTNPPSLGSSRSNPAAIGTAAIWVDGSSQISQKVLQVVRGDSAWQKIKAANMFNSPATSGTEYVLISLQGNYQKGDTNKTYELDPGNCVLVSSDGHIFQSFDNMAVPPAPDYRREVFPGATLTGWAVYSTFAGDPSPLLQCGRKYDGSGGVWFSLK